MIHLSCVACQNSNGKTNIPFATDFTTTDSLKESAPEDSASAIAVTEAEKPKKDITLSLALTGDIMLGTTYPTVKLPANDGKNVLDDVRELLINADVALGNLECAVTDSGTCTKGSGPNVYAFRTPTAFADRLQEAGYDYLGLANNHANDFGPVGVRDTENTLKKLGIAYSGHKGHTPFAIIERNGLKIACMAFGQNEYSMRNTEYYLLRKTIKDAKAAGADLVFISLHGGAEGKAQSHIPRQGHETAFGEDRGNLREFAHIAIDAGADLIYGHGPHVTRAVELYKGRFIAYSLGNFATPYGMSLTGISGYAPVVTVNINGDGEFLDGQIHSFIQQPGVGPRKDNSGSVAKEMRNLTYSDIDDLQIDVTETGAIVKK